MKTTRPYIILLLLLAFQVSTYAQWQKTESVLKDHTWYKIGVVEDGVYALDRETLLTMGVDVQSLDPSRIRMFGNVAGMLPEANSAARYDDLTELAIQLVGMDDGSFDANDQIRFYGQGPVKLTWNNQDAFDYERNNYSDTVYYFLCTDSDGVGLRMTENPAGNVPEGSATITRFVDCVYHENEEMSPYASGRRWYGDLMTPAESPQTFSFEIPDLITSEALRVKSRVLGRASSRFAYSIKLNNNVLVNQTNLEAYASHKYGSEHEASQQCFVDTDHLDLSYSIDLASGNPVLYIDYFTVSAWRALRFRGGNLAFRVLRSQLTTSVSEVQLNGMTPSATCWNVTDPLHPSVQLTTLQAGRASFAIESNGEKRYHVFDSDGLKTVASGYPIHNQNLHAVTSTEMLIISPRLFWEQAVEIADYHRETDGMSCLVADIDEIYNEFGSGMKDPTAMRDFIRMVYLRSESALRYVLLMGKGTHDYRDIKDYGNNFVPTYENAERPWSEVSSMCTDDFFALMDVSEGEDCLGRVDIGIGRFPITTPEQGDDVIRKIKHYDDLSKSHGPWRNYHLFVADNDSKTYMNYCQYLEKMIDTARGNMTTRKLYADSYPVEKTPWGMRIPQAHDALMEAINQGVCVMSYTGHGGVKGLMEELIITNSDILALNNMDRMPFVHTATCEFSKFDNPSLVSAGELLFLNPHGGAIAMLTTVRPTTAPNNQQLSKALHAYVYERENGLPLRLGDIVRQAKSDPKYFMKDNIGNFLFGDPALRLGTAREMIKTTQVNGEDLFQGATATAASVLAVEGLVSQSGNKIDTLFNGVVEVCLYDKKTKYSTLGLHFDPMDYYFHNDVLFTGKATVTNGRFSVEVPLPLEVNYYPGNARLSYYAYDSIRNVDAMGVCDRLEITQAPSSLVLDQQGPEIHLYWNTPDFVDHDVVARNGVLYADLFDEQGIYHYNVSIGRDLVLNSSVDEYDNLIVNDRYEPAVDDYRRGRVVLPIQDLDNGTHQFRLKAWDTQNNASEVELVITVEDGIMLAEVRNFPNPFTTETYFSFVHGDKTEPISVRIEVFDLFGRRVKDIRKQTSATSGIVPAVPWDGRNDLGHPLKAGVYVYRLSITDAQGVTRTVSRRLMIG